MTSAPATDPGPPPPSPAPLPTRTDRFFSWSAGLGIVRGDGWIGGVAAGLASRLRVDPLIIRGVLVVIGLFGFPALLLYAVAWALLPDLDGRIVLQDALRGRFSPALVGVALFAIAGLIPTPALVLIGSPALSVWSYGGTAAALGLLAMILLAVAGFFTFLIVRSARRTPGSTVTDLRSASAGATGPDTSADDAASGPALDADGPVRDAVVLSDTASLTAPLAPATPPVGDDDEDEDEMAAWRAQHAAWKEQDQLWRQQQQDAARAAREQARRERQVRATAFAAEAGERRRLRRAINPRAPFAYVAAAIGLAVILGTALALQQADALAPALGLFVAGAVLSAAMVLAGILRRRSGFLAFVTAMTLLAGLGALIPPAANTLHLASYGISNAGDSRFSANAPFVQPWGDLTVTLTDTGRAGQTHIEKRAGSTFVVVMPGVEVTLEVTTEAASVFATESDPATPQWGDITEVLGAAVQTLPDGSQRYTATIANVADGEEPTTTEHVVIDQDAGYVEFYLQAPVPEEDQP